MSNRPTPGSMHNPVQARILSYGPSGIPKEFLEQSASFRITDGGPAPKRTLSVELHIIPHRLALIPIIVIRPERIFLLDESQQGNF